MTTAAHPVREAIDADLVMADEVLDESRRRVMALRGAGETGSSLPRELEDQLADCRSLARAGRPLEEREVRRCKRDPNEGALLKGPCTHVVLQYQPVIDLRGLERGPPGMLG